MSAKRARKNRSAHLGTRWWRTLILRVLAFALLWWILVEGRFADPWLAMACIAAAVATAYVVRPLEGWRLRPLGLVWFIPFFAWHALRGGVDVALRAFNPRMPLEPGFMEYRLRGSEACSLILAWTVSLLPGTASVRLTERTLKIHVLDQTMPIRESLEALEARILKTWS